MEVEILNLDFFCMKISGIVLRRYAKSEIPIYVSERNKHNIPNKWNRKRERRTAITKRSAFLRLKRYLRLSRKNVL